MPRKPAWRPETEFLGGSDWARTHRAAVVASSTGCSMKAAVALVAATPLRRSDWYGSSVEFEEWLRDNRAALQAPEGDIVPLTGTPGWLPEHEEPAALMCPECSGPLRVVAISPGIAGPLPREAIRPAAAFHEIGPPEMPLRLPAPCTKCGGAIERTSHLHCPKCQATGYDARLARQQFLAGTPPPYRKPAPRNDDGAIPLPAPKTVGRPARRLRQARKLVTA